MNLHQYIQSEAWIHDDLLARAEAVVAKLPDYWRRDGRVATVLLSWPEVALRGDDGSAIEDVCVFDLSGAEIEQLRPLVRAAASRTKAYGLLLVEQQRDAVLASFETEQGSRVWRLPIRRHGDVLALEKPDVSTDGPAVGLLWKPRPPKQG